MQEVACRGRGKPWKPSQTPLPPLCLCSRGKLYARLFEYSCTTRMDASSTRGMGRDEGGRARSPIRADFSVLEIGDEMVPLLEREFCLNFCMSLFNFYFDDFYFIIVN